MRRLAALIVVLTLVPASTAWATELDELLERSREASYSAEQLVTCFTPDGERAALLEIAQSGGQIQVQSATGGDVEVSSGFGGWTLSRNDGVVSSVSVDHSEDAAFLPVYVVEEGGRATYLGREVMVYRLIRDDVLRAELILDVEIGVLVWATTFSADGSTYCERRFISLDPTSPELEPVQPSETETLVSSEPVATSLPEELAGFQRLDLYVDEDGFTFAYYSDGFFSFAVFQTPAIVTLPDATSVEVGGAGYERLFTAGQVTYAWETRIGGMALVGDLPPDLHEPVLSALPQPEDPGFLRRLWRSLFG